MLNRVRNLAGALLVGTALVLTPLAADSAAAQRQQGLVNVNVDDVTILENVGIGVAAQVVAQICGVSVGNVAVLAATVAQTQVPTTVCTAQADQDSELDVISIRP